MPKKITNALFFFSKHLGNIFFHIHMLDYIKSKWNVKVETIRDSIIWIFRINLLEEW